MLPEIHPGANLWSVHSREEGKEDVQSYHNSTRTSDTYDNRYRITIRRARPLQIP